MHTARGSFGMGAGILGLLIVVAIILYLMVGPMGGGSGGTSGAGGGGTSYLGAVKGARDEGFDIKIQTLAYSLDQMIATYVISNGKYPETFDDMDAPPGAFRDPWGNDITFSINKANQELTVTSGGPDGEIGTSDDIVHTRQLSVGP